MELSESCVVKALLHAAKYPSKPVIGVLLSSASSSSSSSSSSSDSKEIKSNSNSNNSTECVHTVCLFHNYPLAPLLELAMIQLEEYCKSKNLQPFACYFANELLTDFSLNKFAIKLATKMAEHYPATRLLQINNNDFSIQSYSSSDKDRSRWTLDDKSMQPKIASSTLQLFIKKLKEWKKTQVEIEKSSSSSSSATELVVDFEDHLENVKSDWLP
eukprot:TRINITY_DN642_c3_g1_i1.p1 TRINITY_DN642_c3_g1~~TRINITY_DN642_c3_g1_i1.p1  ORF type:complete len:215 (+),score=76.20 TRINITY_DN642_c3_g1_i1:65-709(+)